MNIEEIRSLAARVRISSLEMVNRANASHIGGAFSMTELLAVLYSGILRITPQNPTDDERDRFILSNL